MLKVGMKALIIGSRTKSGERFIGWEVLLEQEVHTGATIVTGTKFPFVATFRSDSRGFVVSRSGLKSHSDMFEDGFAMFASKHLMPIPPLEDPGIDECTFTPIIQKETA